MSKLDRKRKKPPKRRLIKPRASITKSQQSEDPDARILRTLSAEPNTAAIWGVIAFLFLVSIFAYRYVMDPGLIARPWLYVVATLIAIFTFWAASNLTTMAYCFLFHRDTVAARAFIDSLGKFAAIGAILGTLLGLRLATPFLDEIQNQRTGHRQPFMEFIGLIGSTATILTLLMVGFCWVRAVAAVKLTMRKNVGTSDAQIGEAKSCTTKWSRRVLSAGLLIGGNYAGVKAAWAIWFILTTK
ncbi:MAG TPA: hypothetical protein VFQ77_14150 [Pseudonocardiaceae bacterium]|jgi:hypothetical protein|nr:hypothetical protein [Pseudonocardiaceae bacterium]